HRAQQVGGQRRARLLQPTQQHPDPAQHNREVLAVQTQRLKARQRPKADVSTPRRSTMQYHYYKSDAPDTVAIVQDYYRAKDQFRQQLEALGAVIGGEIAPMHDIDSNFAGGVKLSESGELDVHWRRPDEWGYRSLRSKAVPPKGISKEERAAIRAEHDRLLTTWREHCPARISKLDYWERLNVNTGNVL